jgi:predicted DNA-binding helix-hairpin-helix protein
VVGAVDETDRELLNASQYLTNSLKLRRAYYSKFSPIPGTPLENNPCANPWRTHRLYQAFFLLRDYGFSTTDLPFDPTGSLPLSSDPKLAWAEAHLKHAPVEINRAEMVQLLKIPGIGPVAARAILSTRRKQPLRCIEDLLSLGIRANRAAPYILLAGRRPISQPTLF